MKLTKLRLKQIIKEELEKAALSEVAPIPPRTPEEQAIADAAAAKKKAAEEQATAAILKKMGGATRVGGPSKPEPPQVRELKQLIKKELQNL